MGNAVTEGRQIVVGAGSSEVLMAGLYAMAGDLSAENKTHAAWTPSQLPKQGVLSNLMLQQGHCCKAITIPIQPGVGCNE